MLEIRIHGRGGQGGVIALEVLANGYFKQGQFVQVFPEFGAERRGAPVAAFMRVDTRPVRLRCKIYKPDCIIVLDPVLLNSVDVTEGLKKGGWVLINSEKTAPALKLGNKFNIATVNATAIASKYGLGSRTSPIVNTTMLGAFCRLPLKLNLSTLKQAIRDKIKIKTNNNILAAEEAYRNVTMQNRLNNIMYLDSCLRRNDNMRHRCHSRPACHSRAGGNDTRGGLANYSTKQKI